MSLLLGPEPFQKFVVGGGWVLNWILVLRFGPNLELRLEAGPSLTTGHFKLGLVISS